MPPHHWVILSYHFILKQIYFECMNRQKKHIGISPGLHAEIAIHHIIQLYHKLTHRISV